MAVEWESSWRVVEEGFGDRRVQSDPCNLAHHDFHA